MTEAQQSIPFGMRREQVGLKGRAKRKSKVGSVRCGGCYGVGGKPAELFGIGTLLVFKNGSQKNTGSQRVPESVERLPLGQKAPIARPGASQLIA